MDQNLNWISHRKAIDRHEVRPVPLLCDKEPVVQMPTLPPKEKSELSSQVTITNSTVTINYR